MQRIMLMITVLAVVTLLVACGLRDDEVESVAQTAEGLPSSALAALAGTVEAMSPEEIEVLRQAALSAGYPTLSPDERQIVVSTVVAARATATAVGAAAASGERVNATEVPNQAPVIVYFFASAPTPAQVQDGIRYFLNWTTENANRVEIFGSVMDNPQEGSWPVYNESDHWVLWAANDTAWVEQFLPVAPDADTGNSLQDVTVNGNQITLTFRDPQFVDGDQINVDVNGVRVIGEYVTTGRHVSFPVVLQSGANTVSINAQYVGVLSPMVTEITVSNVTSGPGTQLTRGLNTGESQGFTITAP